PDVVDPADRRTLTPLAQHLPGDDELLDLARAFVDAEQPRVAVEALDRDAAHVARAAVDLHRAVGHAADGLRADVLRRRRPEPGVRAGSERPGALQHQRAGGQRVGLRVGQQRLHELVAGDRLAALAALAGEGDGLLH